MGSKINALIKPALVMCLAVACCSQKPGLVDRQPPVAMTVLHHPTGLALRVPEGAYEVAPTAAGFRLSPVGSAKRRTPVEVTVELRAGATPPGKFPELRVIHGRTFRYRVDNDEGGSSGDERVLRAWTELGPNHVWIEQSVAVEPPATADFTPAWQIAERLEPPAP